MRLTQNLKSWAADRAISFLVSVARTEGWQTGPDRGRSSPKLTSQDEEYNNGTREKMMSEARALCQTFGMATNILGRYANYCVGNCAVDFHTGDDEWDKMAEDRIRQRFETIDVGGRHNLASMAKLGLKSAIRDGDMGFAKVLDSGFPQLQGIEADRIRTTSTPFEYLKDGEEWVYGVRKNRLGRAVEYRVWERRTYYGFQNPKPLPAESFILLCSPQRFDGCRGVTWFERGTLNRMRDLKEILAAESKSVKTISKWAMFFTRQSGGRPQSQTAQNLFGQKKDGSGSIHTEELNNGMQAYGIPGDNAQAIMHNRPSPTFQGFLEFLIRDIATSLELPLGFVWAMLGTGPAIRLDSRLAEKTFTATSEWLERNLLNPVCGWLVNWEMQNGGLPFNPNWYQFTFPRPSHPSIDVGRESLADLNELDRGITCEIDLAAERGKNAVTMLRQRAKFQKDAREIANEFKVPLESIVGAFAEKTKSTIEHDDPHRPAPESGGDAPKKEETDDE